MKFTALIFGCLVNMVVTQYSRLPNSGSVQIRPFEIKVPEPKVRDMETLIRLSPVGKATYENLKTDGSLGLNRNWLVETKKHWMEKFKWEEHENYINSFPHYIANIHDEDGTRYDMHFMALFSEKRDAIPILLLHGWPGSFLEFLGVFSDMKKKYGASDLPYHLVAPSLLGYGFSSDPPTAKDWHVADNARIINKLMLQLGFTSYLAQGGDIGSFTAQSLSNNHKECKAIHVNFLLPVPGAKGLVLETSAKEAKGLERMSKWMSTGNAYTKEHETRPATIGLTLAASPIALLAWIGEKFIDWSDRQLPIDEVLRSVSFYWLTETYPTSIYPYRDNLGQFTSMKIEKPFGYSWYPKELMPVPKSWASERGNMTWFKSHDRGGHFAAMENPETFMSDLEEFASQVWIKERL